MRAWAAAAAGRHAPDELEILASVRTVTTKGVRTMRAFGTDEAPKPRSEFEHAAYAFARQWATGINRRQLLKAFGAAGAAAALGPLASSPLLAAPRSGLTLANLRLQGGNALKIARGQESDTLDPQKTALLVAHEVCWQIYDSLIYLDEKGTVFPGAATSWTFSPDHKTLTFKLRPGFKFHDGTPLDASPVAFTVHRHPAKATASPTSYMLGPLDPANPVQVIDPLTVAYRYTEPFVPLFVGLGYSYCAPISPAAVQKYGDQFGRHPVGTGPYKFIAWNADGSIDLEANPDHNWATPFYHVTGGPTIPRASFVVIPEDATRVSSLESGEVDIISGTDALPVDKIKELETYPGLKVVKRPAVGVDYCYINTTLKPLDDVRVRQAINYAVDKDKLITLVLDGQGKPAVSPLASAFGDFNPNVMKYPHDPEKAKSLLTAAGVDKGFEIPFLTIASDLYQQTAEVVQEDLSKVGIKTKIQSYPVAELFTKGPQKQFGLLFFYYTYSDPDVLYLLCSSKGSIRWSFQNDPQLDQWLDQQRVEFDPTKRKQILDQAQARVVESALWLFL